MGIQWCTVAEYAIWLQRVFHASVGHRHLLKVFRGFWVHFYHAVRFAPKQLREGQADAYLSVAASGVA